MEELRSINLRRPSKWNMIALLGVLMVVTVSGDVQVEGILGDSVLLPCSCSGRATTKTIKWQMEEKFIVFKKVGNETYFHKNYNGRATVLLEHNSSLLLNSTKKEDQGRYICICRIDEEYTDFPVNLTVVAEFNVCQKSETGNSPEGKNVKVFHCNVSGHDKEAKIQWYFDGQQLTNTSETTITHACTLDTVNGISWFSSNLTTHLKILNPKCHVESEDVPTKIKEKCNGNTDQSVQPPQERRRYISIIPLVAAVGLCVVLWRLRKFS